MSNNYFNRFTVVTYKILLSLSICAMCVLIYNDINQVLNSTISEDDLYNTPLLLRLILKGFLVSIFIYTAICFYLFMSMANTNGIFTPYSSKMLKRISMGLLILGIASGFALIKDHTKVLQTLLFLLVASITYSFSKIFNESTQMKEESDLTI